MYSSDNLLHLLQGHLARCCDVQIQDVYKLLFQGIFGAEHILHDVDRARTFLEEEWERTAPNAEEVLTEAVSLPGHIIRVNISRCRFEGIRCSDLWLAFRCSNEATGNTGDLRKIWQEFGELCSLGLLPFDNEDVMRFGRQVDQEGFPARHHSQAYRRANRPAYRVVKKHEFDALCIHTEDDKKSGQCDANFEDD